MKVEIVGTEKEIAALVLEIQGRQEKDIASKLENHIQDLTRQMLQEVQGAERNSEL